MGATETDQPPSTPHEGVHDPYEPEHRRRYSQQADGRAQRFERRQLPRSKTAGVRRRLEISLTNRFHPLHDTLDSISITPGMIRKIETLTMIHRFYLCLWANRFVGRRVRRREGQRRRSPK